MAQKRKATSRKPQREPTAGAETTETGPKPRRTTPKNAEERRSDIETPSPQGLGVPGVETSQEAIVCIAQDAVLILRHELAYRAVQSIESPGEVSMFDCISLLRLTTELGAAAARGAEELGQKANYDRLSPSERVQLAALLLKVDYLDAP